MKHLVFWSSLILTTIILYYFYNKGSYMDTFFNLNQSPFYTDVIFILLGLHLAIPRIYKLFKTVVN